MIHKLSDYKIKNLNSISPSQYYSAISCPYKLVLANSFEYQPLLPINVNAHFGSIIHKMIELISKGVIIDEKIFSENWINLINKKEAELIRKGLAHLTPLKYFVNDFALKKNQIKNIWRKKQEKISYATKTSLSEFYPEKRLENPEKSIIGIADLVIENDSGTTILDFKIGKIYSDELNESGITEQVVKKEYEIQLKLYAQLYFLMNGKYPNSLFIVTLTNDYIKVGFEHTECEKVYLEALNFLTSTNSFITKGDMKSIAKPSIENCKYCSYRPACCFYSNWLITNFENVNDLYGTIKKVNTFNNDTLGLQLQIADIQVLINCLPVSYKEGFESLVNKNVIIFNLKKSIHSFNASANNFTVVYEKSS